jgi:class 3 adenylate cyclase/tetratricopeptide (TPR) repeat protein
MSNALPSRRAEQITATILFADIVGFSALSAKDGPEKAYLAVTQLLGLLDKIARKHSGSVDKYLGDKLMAVFGYPVPLEHPASAAAAAALEMRQRVHDFNREAGLAVSFGIRMGINAGELVGGDIQGPVVREFHVLGDAVNVAARLNAKAPVGEIWVGQSIYEQAHEDFTWDTLEPLHLKGKSHSVAAHALKKARGTMSRSSLGFDEQVFSDLIGRAAQLMQLREHLQALGAGRGGGVLLTGEEGAGKSRLLVALGESDEIEALAVLQTRGSPLERDRAFAALSPLVIAWAGIDSNDGIEQQRVTLRRVIERRLPVNARDARFGLAHLLDPGAAGDRSRAETQDIAARVEAVFEALVRSVTADRPLLLVIEDLQWLDASSLAFMERLIALTTELPLFVLLTGRAGVVTSQLARAMERAISRPSDPIDLGPLDRDSSSALVHAALGAAADDETVELVLERGRGVPGPLLAAAFLAPALRSERDQAAGRADRTSESERRRAVVLFADITGFTAMTERVGADAAYPVVAACLDILDEVARAHGGTVDHYLGDCVMALFGVPHAIEDAPRAALNAAIDMRRRIQDFREAHDLPVLIDVHTGVASGLGIAGDISGPLIREFAVMGDHVDRADELTHVAEAGEIRVDHGTYHATREIFEFGESPSRVLAGAPDPQRVWDLRSTVPRLYRARLGTQRKVFSELVGRDEELAIFRGVMEALGQGMGGVVSLVAEAGIGKSRLLAELRDHDDSILWLEGRSLSNGRNLSYHPIADLVRSSAGIGEDDDDVGAREKLDGLISGLLPDREAEMAPLLATLVGAAIASPERERLDAIQGDALEKLVRSAVLQLLRAASTDRPIVVLMEDLHWADLSSIELLESLLRLTEERRIVFLNAFRPGFEETSERMLSFVLEKFSDRHVQVDLQPLGAGAARALVKNLFRGGNVPQKTRAAIEERAQGNPFFIEEVVRSLVDAGALVFHDGGFQATERLESVVIPDTVQEAVLARVDRLGLLRRSVLQAASVIGGVFHLDVLQTMIDDAENLEILLEELQDREFIVPQNDSSGVEYAFKHPLIQEVTYDSMLETRRSELHLDVAKAAEFRLSDGVPGYSAMLAYHYSKGGDIEHAEEYLFRAGDEAARAAASNEALHFFQEASALYAGLHGNRGDPNRRALLEKNLAIALLNRGRLIEAVDHFDQATKLLGAPAPRGTMAMGAAFAVNLARVIGRLYLGRRPYGRRAATERERELIDVMFRRAFAQSTSAPTRFLVDSIALIRRFSEVDPYTVPETAAMYAGGGSIFSYGGLSFGLGRRFLEIAEELAEGGAVDERVLYFRTLRFLHHLLDGDWSDAYGIEPEAVDQGLRDGRFWEASTYTNLDGVKQVYQGHFAVARERIAKLAEIADLYEHDLAASAQHAVTAYLQVERRELEPALETLELYYDEHAEATFNLLALGTRAKVNCLMGDVDEAEANLQRAERVLSEAGRIAPYHASSVRSARYLANVTALERAIRNGEGSVDEALGQVRKHRAAALSTARKVAFRMPEVLRLAAREAWLRERKTEALDWWGQAFDCCQRLDARPELGRTLGEAGLALRIGGGDLRGRDAAACLDEARTIFGALDLEFDRAQIFDAA